MPHESVVEQELSSLGFTSHPLSCSGTVSCREVVDGVSAQQGWEGPQAVAKDSVTWALVGWSRDSRWGGIHSSGTLEICRSLLSSAVTIPEYLCRSTYSCIINCF